MNIARIIDWILLLAMITIVTFVYIKGNYIEREIIQVETCHGAYSGITGNTTLNLTQLDQHIKNLNSTGTKKEKWNT